MLAQQLTRKGQFKQALQIYRQILLTHPNHIPTLDAYAGISLGQGQAKEAQVTYEHLLSILPDSIEVHVGLIEALLDLEERNKAFQQAQKLLNIHPQELKPHLCMAMLYEKKGNNNQALYHYQKANELKPDSYEAKLGQGRLLFRMGQYPEAIQIFQELLQIFSGNTTVKEELAKCFWLHGELEKAIELFLHILKFPLQNKAEIYRLLFLIYSEQQNEKEAQKYLQLFRQGEKSLLPHSEFFLISVTLFFILLTTSFLAQNNRRAIAINGTALFLALSLAELYFHWQNNPNMLLEDDEINIPSFYCYDEQLGFKAIANQRSLSYIIHNNKINAANIYSSNDDGWRHTPSSNPQANNCLFFFGDSFSFGWGVADYETLPHYIGVLANSPYNIHNISLPAYGPHQMLAFLEELPAQKLTCQKTFAFFSTISDHVMRSAGLGEKQKGPRYTLQEDGGLKRAGNYGQQNKDDFSNIEQAFRQQVARKQEIELYLKIIEKSAQIIKDKFSQDLQVIFWDNWYPSDLDEQIIIGLQEKNIKYHKISDILPDYTTKKENYMIPIDLHPNATAYQETAAYLCQTIADLCK